MFIFRYHYILLFGFALLLPLVLLWLFYAKRRSHLVQNYLGFIDNKKLINFFSLKKEIFLIIWIFLECTFVILAFARPQRLDKKGLVEQSAVDVVIALDISLSMLAQDLKPSRLEVAKSFAKKIIYYLEGNRFALVYFAGRSFVQSPLTLDYASLFSFLDSIEAGLIPEAGTALGSAIELSIERFVSVADQNNTKVMLLLTDGEETKDSYQEAIKKARENHIKIYTIGVGSAGGGAIPVKGNLNEYMRDDNGDIYISKLNRGLLNKIALSTDGNSYLLSTNDVFSILEDILKKIKEIPAYTVEGIAFEQRSEYFWVFLSIVCVMMTLRFLFGSSLKGFLTRLQKVKKFSQLLLLLFVFICIFEGCSLHESFTGGKPKLFYSYLSYRQVNRSLELQAEIEAVNQDVSTQQPISTENITHAISYYEKILGDPLLTVFAISRIYLNIALLYTRISKFEEANYYYLKALKFDNINWQEEILYNQGTNYLLWNKFSESIEVYIGVLKINSLNYDAKYNLQVALYLKENSPEQENQENQEEQKEQEEQGENKKQEKKSNDETTEDSEKQKNEKTGEQKQEESSKDNISEDAKPTDSNKKRKELSTSELKTLEATKILDALQEREQQEYKDHLQKLQKARAKKNSNNRGGLRW